MLKQLIISIFLLIFSSVNNDSGKLPEKLNGKVVGVLDGDTIDFLYKGKALRVRLEHIDCPEVRTRQPFGMKAKQFTSDLCFGKQVQIQHRNKYDRNKRLIGVVILQGGYNLNYELVKAGLAWHFIKYSKDKHYTELELAARKSRIGLWSENSPTPPWQWRAPKRIR